MRLQDVKLFLRMLWTFFVKMFVVVFWTCFFVVPGILCLVDFAFSEIVAFESPNLDIKGVFMLSKELAKGQKWMILRQFLFSLVIVLSVGAAMFFVLRFFDVLFQIPPKIYLIFIAISVIVAFFPTFEILIAKTFSRAKNEKIMQFSSKILK